MNKKGVIDQLYPLVIGLVTIGIVLVVGFLIISEAKSQALTVSGSNTSLAFNGSRDTQNALADIPTWLPIIVITIIGALLIGLVSLFRRG